MTYLWSSTTGKAEQATETVQQEASGIQNNSCDQIRKNQIRRGLYNDQEMRKCIQNFCHKSRQRDIKMDLTEASYRKWNRIIQLRTVTSGRLLRIQK
jgi:hypothetical protein